MRIVAMLQARLHSSRLPEKMLLPLLGQPLVQHVIERVRRATRLDFVILAYPLQDSPAFLPILRSFTDTPGVPLGSWAGQGDESDLIDRFLGAACAYEPDIIVRIPCDNPCVDPEWIDAAVAHYLGGSRIFFSNTIGAPDGQQYLDGIGAEVFSLSRLKLLDSLTTGQPRLREHIHAWFAEHLAEVYDPSLGHNPLYPVVRLDVNTQSEYEFIAALYAHFGHNQFTANDILSYLSTQEVSYATRQSPAHRAESSGSQERGTYR